MKRKRTLIAGLSATLAMAALVVVAAWVASPASTQATSGDVPSIQVKDVKGVFNVSWVEPEGVTPTDQRVHVWTDDGFREVTTAVIPVGDDARSYEFDSPRVGEPGNAYGFRVSMLDGDERIQSRARFKFPNGPMPKRTPASLEAHWHNDGLRLGWAPGRNPNYVAQVAKCRTQDVHSTWETIELARHVMTASFEDLDSSRSYVCRVGARKEAGGYQLSNAADADRKRIATPGDIQLARTAPDADTVRFGWSVDTAGISKLLVQREGPLPNDRFPTEPSWKTIAELGPDATSHVDTITVEDEVVSYNYRVVAVPERGGSTVSWRGVCRLERSGETEYYNCGRASSW